MSEEPLNAGSIWLNVSMLVMLKVDVSIGAAVSDVAV